MGELEEKTCPRCGMPQEDWKEPEGYTKDGEAYCCKGCAEDEECECGDAQEAGGDI